MKQIYNFDTKQPPVLNESMLQAELEKRRLRRQTTIATMAGILVQIAILLLALLLSKQYPLLSMLCVVYVIISATGSTVVAILLHSDLGKRTLQQS